MPATESTVASCEVNSHPAPRSPPHPKWNASEFQCSICYELLLNPVVGNCGHDFCKHCIEEWKTSRQLVGQAVLCPICRAVLLPSADQSFGVCIRLRETIEKLFPEQVAQRRRHAGLAEKSRKCTGDCGPAAFPLSASPTVSTTTASTSTDTSTATTTTTSNATTSNGSPDFQGSPSGGAPGPPLTSLLNGGGGGGVSSYSLLDLDLLTRAAEQYLELSMLVSAITAVPAPAQAVVQAFTQAAASMADQAAARSGVSGGGGPLAAPLPPQQAAEIARLFLSSGAALTSTAAAASALQAQNPHHQHYHHLPQQQQQQPTTQLQAFQAQSYGGHPAAVALAVHAQPYVHRQEPLFAIDAAAAAGTAAAVAAMSTPEANASAAMAAQLAAAAAGGGGPGVYNNTGAATGGGFLEAALTLLTSAAATSTAAGQLRTLVSALHHQQHQQHQAATAAAVEGGSDVRQAGSMAAASEAAGDALRTTANTVQQLTAEAAAMSQLLRIHHQQQLHAHMQAAAQAQSQALQLQTQQHSQYLGHYLMATAAPAPAALAPPTLVQPHQVLLGWGTATQAASPAGPVLVVAGAPGAGLQAVAAAGAGYHLPPQGHQSYMLPYQQQPYHASVPPLTAAAVVPPGSSLLTLAPQYVGPAVGVIVSAAGGEMADATGARRLVSGLAQTSNPASDAAAGGTWPAVDGPAADVAAATGSPSVMQLCYPFAEQHPRPLVHLSYAAAPNVPAVGAAAAAVAAMHSAGGGSDAM